MPLLFNNFLIRTNFHLQTTLTTMPKRNYKLLNCTNAECDPSADGRFRLEALVILPYNNLKLISARINPAIEINAEKIAIKKFI